VVAPQASSPFPVAQVMLLMAAEFSFLVVALATQVRVVGLLR